MDLPVTLYTRAECPLCDELRGQVAALPVSITTVDVDADPALRDRYGWRVPVLVDAAGEVLAEGRLDAAGLERLRRRVEEARA